MEYKLLTPKISGFERKIRHFHEEIYHLLVQASLPIHVWFRAGLYKMVFSLKLIPNNYPAGVLELWYNIYDGYYWYRYIVAGTGKKYSASELLTTEFISQDLKMELDTLFHSILAIYNNELTELSTAINNDKANLLGYTEFTVMIIDEELYYKASVMLPTLEGEKYIMINYINGNVEGFWKSRLKDVFPLG